MCPKQSSSTKRKYNDFFFWSVFISLKQFLLVFVALKLKMSLIVYENYLPLIRKYRTVRYVS